MNSTRTFKLPDVRLACVLQKPVAAVEIVVTWLMLGFLAGPAIELSTAAMIPVAVCAWFCHPCITKHLEALYTHGLCPNCLKHNYGKPNT